MLICSANHLSLPESWQLNPSGDHSCGY